jgi:predicted HTH transcriptional regulator
MIYIIVVLSFIVLFLLLHRPTKERVVRVTSDAVGVCAVALERTSQKEKRKARVLELLQESGEMGNEDIRERLGVSARSVVNYMNELEAEGKVEQIGVTGRSVTYQLKP